jgi:hypothetical protein
METFTIKDQSTAHSQSSTREEKHLSLRIRVRQKLIKLKHWEYWPMEVVYFLPAIYFLYISLRERSILFFTASNPSIETGGMFFESKWSIFKRLPTHLYPKTIFISEEETFDSVLKKLGSAEINFPLIAKPDRGERGRGVKLIHSVADLSLYHRYNRVDFLIQQFVDYPVELSVFYFRRPGEKDGTITSLTGKELLGVTGDGVSSIKSLILKNDRALLHYTNLCHALGASINEVLMPGEFRILVPYGNHCRGAMFIDMCSSISPELVRVFDELGKSVDGFYFGRFDVRCKSLDDLAMGRDFYILELNGAGGEPAHIYDPAYSFFKGQLTLFRHFSRIYEVSLANHKSGVPYMSYKEFRNLWTAQKEYRKRLTWL